MTRKEAIKVLANELKASLMIFGEKNDKETQDALKMAIEALNRPNGEWIFKHNSSDIWCSNCDENFDEIPQKFLFCPNCGSDNRPKIHGCSFADETCKNNPCEDCGLKEGEANE